MNSGLAFSLVLLLLFACVEGKRQKEKKLEGLITLRIFAFSPQTHFIPSISTVSVSQLHAIEVKLQCNSFAHLTLIRLTKMTFV